jgi:3-hydroxyisobutyrate dehydrogenase-like beta-hydroxyacid dehydrogenase
MARVAFLGTGLIGSGMVEALVRQKEEVTVWNRSIEKAKALEKLGANVAKTIEQAVGRAERVHMALSDDAAVDGILSEVVSAMPLSGRIFDHTTASPKGVAERVKRLDARGIFFLHCPIFMSPQNARDATGLMLVSGARDRVEGAEKVLRRMTGEVWYLGERPDLAAAYKLFGNAMILAIVGGLADVFDMAESLGIAATDAHALFQKFKPAFTIDVRGARMAKKEFTPASFTMQMARKDVRLMLEAAGAKPLSILPALAKAMDDAIAEGKGDLDCGAL